MAQASAAARPVVDDCWNRIGVRGDGSCKELSRHVHCRNCPVYAAAAVELLDRELPPDHLAAWAMHFARPNGVERQDTVSVVIFRIGAEWLALPTAVFSEVAALRGIHSLPHRRSGLVLGLANVRGELLVCVSLARLLGTEPGAPAERDSPGRAHKRLLVISRDGDRLVCPVDEVHGIHRSQSGELKPVPATVAKAKATYTKGMLSWQEKAVGCLDEQLLFYTLNRSLA